MRKVVLWGTLLITVAITGCFAFNNNLAGRSTNLARIYQASHFNQLDSLVYIYSNDEIYSGKVANDTGKIVLSRENDIIYNSHQHTNNHRLYRIVDNHILPANTTDVAAALYSWQGDNIYRGPSTTDESQRILTRRDNKLYSGTSTNIDDVIFTFDGDYLILRPFLVLLAENRP
ncbi:MAG: hypothetical protein HY326_10190 [Chloroflexi bacterium]|nr:hypothetical protein [Chloroflexota bacterium]